MKSLFKLLIVALGASLLANAFSNAYAQSHNKARQILDKTASLLNNKGGATANFTMSTSGVGTVSGTIAIKGKKFYASTPQAKTWFNGKTQWTYLTSSNEVSVTNPTAAQQAKMNPYGFITMYKSGYNLSVKQQGNNYNVHLVSTKANQGIKEMYITINKSTNLPSQIKVNEKGKWSTINLKNFKFSYVPDSKFTFNSKDFPRVEVIDLR